jgi:adenylate cyclase
MELTPMDELTAYLPRDRARALAFGVSLPTEAKGAALFADLSGFTPITEAFDRALGARHGAEALTRQLNQVFAVLIVEVERYDGSVLGFAGDAITCWFAEPEREADQPQDAADASARARPPASHRAVACALALQDAIRAFASVRLSQPEYFHHRPQGCGRHWLSPSSGGGRPCHSIARCARRRHS